ncbi:MAG TPA: hypothetical protein PLI17_18950, partial [Denitromonas sp.]|nr:hypothetical protein [Denitromonas sp.]
MTLFAATRGRPSAALAMMLALAVFPASVGAEDTSDRMASSRSDLDAVKSRLRSAQAEVADTESTHAEAAKALKQADVAVSRILRRVRELVRERKNADAAVLKVEASLRETEAQVNTGREAL